MLKTIPIPFRFVTICILFVILGGCSGNDSSGPNTSPTTTPSPGLPTVLTGANSASADAHGWHAIARLVNMEAGPSGLQVAVTVRGPLTIHSPHCDRPLRAWLVNTSGQQTNGSVVFPLPSSQCSDPLEVVAAGKAATYSNLIPFPISRGTYTIHGFLDTGASDSSENLPTVLVTLP